MLYTDGIPDAQNTDGDFFHERRISEILHQRLDATAQEIQSTLLQEVEQFTAGAAQFDDITLLVIKRELNPVESMTEPEDQVYHE
ncbi:MAG: SpoIIE family protein phosphatase [Anaerolineales bacterium]